METQKSKYLQQAYGIGAILLLFFSFCYYETLFSTCYGILLPIIQLAAAYCLLKSHKNINIYSILKSALIPTAFFMVACFLNILGSMTLEFNTWFLLPVFASTELFLYLLTGCLFLCIAWFGYKGKESLSYNKEKCITRISAFVALSLIFCIALSENVSGSYHPSMFFVAGLLFTQAVCSYNLYKLSKKWFAVGNIVLALFFVSLQINMLANYTELIRNTGWAVTYMTSVVAEMLALYGSFAILVSLIPLVYHKLSKNKGQNETEKLTAHS